MTFAESEIVYRDLAGAWGAFRLVVDGQDVTRFRGVPAQIGGYQLTDPYGYGPATFSFPQITSLEVDRWGTDDLAWFDLGKPCHLTQVDTEGNRVRTVWRGFISQVSPGLLGTDVHCDGKASGRLALRDKHPELFTWIKDVGILLDGAFSKCGLNSAPALGLTTGIEVDERDRAGTMLSYCDGLLADAITADGDQLTILPDADGVFTQQWRDEDTIRATIFNGASGVDKDLSRDISEEPTTFYGSGRNGSGLLWVNGKYPGLIQGEAPTFPGTLELGDSGSDVEVLQSKLIGMGYLDREDALGGFDDETEEAVKDLQSDAGLSETGIVNSATWDSLFDLGDTGLSLYNARVFALAKIPTVDRYVYTSNGSKAAKNPDYDPTVIEVDRTVDFKMLRKRRGRRWSRRQLARLQNHKNYVGTITLKTDVSAGDVTHGTTPEQLSRLDLMAGDNIKLRNFDGTTKFHIAGISVESDFTVRLAVDTLARNLLDVGQIHERNRESRISPYRQWRQERRTNGNQRIAEFSEVGGKIWTKIDLEADAWNVFPVIAGQSGSIEQIRLKVEDSACEFVAAITTERTNRAWWADKIGNPFAGDGSAWTSEKARKQIEDARVLLAAWGTEDQPCGYYPGRKTNDAGEATGDDITGKFLDNGGFDYRTQAGECVLWIAIYPKQACVIKPGRILWPVLEAGM